MISFNDQFMPAKMDAFSIYNIQRYISSISHKNTIKWHIQSSICVKRMHCWPYHFVFVVVVVLGFSICVCVCVWERERERAIWPSCCLSHKERWGQSWNLLALASLLFIAAFVVVSVLLLYSSFSLLFYLIEKKNVYFILCFCIYVIFLV